jgi:hypothetical protein
MKESNQNQRLLTTDFSDPTFPNYHDSMAHFYHLLELEHLLKEILVSNQSFLAANFNHFLSQRTVFHRTNGGTWEYFLKDLLKNQNIFFNQFWNWMIIEERKVRSGDANRSRSRIPKSQYLPMLLHAPMIKAFFSSTAKSIFSSFPSKALRFKPPALTSNVFSARRPKSRGNQQLM